jgi:hypothetical protein
MNNMNFGRMTGNQMLSRRFADGGFAELTAPKTGASLYRHPGQSTGIPSIPMPFTPAADYYARMALPVQGDPATAAYRPGQLFFQYGAPPSQAATSPQVEVMPAQGGLAALGDGPTDINALKGGLFDATQAQFDQSQGRAGDGANVGTDGEGSGSGRGGGLGISGSDVGRGLGSLAGGLVGGPLGAAIAGWAGSKIGGVFDGDSARGSMTAAEAGDIAAAASADNAAANAASDAAGGYGGGFAGDGGGATGADPDGGEAYRRGGSVKRFAQGGLAVLANQVRDAATVPGSGLAYLSPDMQRTVAQMKEPQVNPSSGVPQYARGGLSAIEPHNGPGYVGHKEGGGTGRSDGVPAMLSNNEYVIDAETNALLGDGDPRAGAAKLDAMRENIRKQKGKALAKGKISSDAKPAEAYLPKGGK